MRVGSVFELNGVRFRLFRMLKKLNLRSSFASSPKMPMCGSPNSFANDISRLKYFGPRKTLRPIPGRLAKGLPLNGITVLKYLLQPAPELQSAPAIRLFGKMPPGVRKLSLLLLNGVPPRNATGRGSQKLFIVVPSRHPNNFGVQGKPVWCVNIAD